MGAVETFSETEQLPYEVLGVLEETASTTVYLARALPEAPPGQPAHVALERLWTGGAFARERFLDVARVAARVGNPPNRRFFGLGEVDGQPCVVWEALEGMSLAELASMQPSRFGEDRWNAVVCHLVVQAAESILAVMDEGLALGSDFQLTGADLWVLGDGSTRVRVLERLIGEISGSQTAAGHGTPEPSAALRNCLWSLLLGDSPEEAADTQMIVPPGLTRLPPTLQSILLETASGGPGLQTMNVTGLVGALRSFLAHESRRPSPAELTALLVPPQSDADDRRAPKDSGIAPIIKVGEQALEEDTELDVSIDVSPMTGDETAIAVSTPERISSLFAQVGSGPSQPQTVESNDGAPPVASAAPLSSAPGPASSSPSMSSPFVLPTPPSLEELRGKSRFDELPELPKLAPDDDQLRASRPPQAPAPTSGPQRTAPRAALRSNGELARNIEMPQEPARKGKGRALLWLLLIVVIGSALGVGGALVWKAGGFGKLQQLLPRTGLSSVGITGAASTVEAEALPRSTTALGTEPREALPTTIEIEPAEAIEPAQPSATGDVGEPAVAEPTAETARPEAPTTMNPTGRARDALQRSQLRRAERQRRLEAAAASLGTVVVQTDGRWADVFSGTRYLGRTPLTVQFEAGEQRIRIRPSGYEGTRTVTVRVQAGQTHELRVPLLTHPEDLR